MDKKEDRVLGNTGISIATHLALETLFTNKDLKKLEVYDTKKELYEANVNEYKYHYFNVYTLIRNILGSFTTKPAIDNISFTKDIYTILSKEFNIIRELYSNTKCTPILIRCNYEKIYEGYNIGKETADTAIYKEHLLVKDVIDNMYKKELVSGKSSKTHIFPPIEDKVLITTNLPVDLFNKGDITLLESHTGRVKTKLEFSTKYKKFGKKDLSILPFTEELLYVFGDNAIITPIDLKTRQRVYEVSMVKRWNPSTTRDKVLADLKSNNIDISAFKPMYKGVSYAEDKQKK